MHWAAQKMAFYFDVTYSHQSKQSKTKASKKYCFSHSCYTYEEHSPVILEKHFRTKMYKILGVSNKLLPLIFWSFGTVLMQIMNLIGCLQFKNGGKGRRLYFHLIQPPPHPATHLHQPKHVSVIFMAHTLTTIYFCISGPGSSYNRRASSSGGV